jgi:hypothetical protein
MSDIPSVGVRTDSTEIARRASRFKAAQARIKKIVDGAPALTDDQLRQLSVLLRADKPVQNPVQSAAAPDRGRRGSPTNADTSVSPALSDPPHRDGSAAA